MILLYTDEELLEGLRRRDSSCIEYFYQEFFPVIRHHLTNNSGNEQDVEDLFQDAIIVLYTRSMSPSFMLQCSLKTFFMSICKNLWLQRLESKCRLLYQADYEVNEPGGEYFPDDQGLNYDNLEQQRLFYKNLMLLPNSCRRLLQLYCLRISYKEIARMLKFKSEDYAKTRKYFCKNLLRKKIMNDPECQQFLNYERTRNHLRLD